MAKQNEGIVNIVDLFLTEPALANRLFLQAQRWYNQTFPPEERESTRTIRGYINDSIQATRDGTDGEGKFQYLTAVLEGRPRGMASFNLIPFDMENGTKGLIGFGNYLAVQKSYRNQDIAKVLLDGAATEANRFARAHGIEEVISFGEVEKPQSVVTDEMRDVIRPHFHHKYSKICALVTVDDNGYATLIPYAMPGIKQHGKAETPTPLLAVMGIVRDGKLLAPAQELGTVIGDDGRIAVPKDRLRAMDARTVSTVLNKIMDEYASAPDTYSPGQVGQIRAITQKALHGQENVYQVPIIDTRNLQYPTLGNFFGFYK